MSGPVCRLCGSALTHTFVDLGMSPAEVATYDGLWAPVDTLKERNALEAMYTRDADPRAVWQKGA